MVLNFFKAITRLNINLGKTEVVGDVANPAALATIICCRVGNLPMT